MTKKQHQIASDIIKKANDLKIPWWEEHILWNLEGLWNNIRSIFNEIRWAHQRVFRGYSDRDLWSLDWCLSKTLSSALRKLRDICYGYPTSPDGKYGFNNATGWNKTLTKMAKGFDAAMKISELKYKNPKGHKKLMKEFNDGMELFKKYYFSLWD